MSLAGEAGVLLAYAVGMLGLFVTACMLIIPIKKILKLIFNSILGGIIIIVVNALGAAAGFHISLNIVTAAIVGIFGVPGLLLVALIQTIF